MNADKIDQPENEGESNIDDEVTVDRTAVKVGFEVDREIEPEVVGHYSAIIRDRCTHWQANEDGSPGVCSNDATHTRVLYDGNDVVSLAVCDEHGSPEQVADDRRWSGGRV